MDLEGRDGGRPECLEESFKHLRVRAVHELSTPELDYRHDTDELLQVLRVFGQVSRDQASHCFPVLGSHGALAGIQ